MNPESVPGDYDEVTRLRLRINHLEIQRDGFAAALRAEVRSAIADILRDELRRQLGHADTVGCQLVELDDIKAENNRLRERVMHFEATWPRDPHHGGKIYSMPIDPLMREAIDSARLAKKEGGAS